MHGGRKGLQNDAGWDVSLRNTPDSWGGGVQLPARGLKIASPAACCLTRPPPLTMGKDGGWLATRG